MGFLEYVVFRLAAVCTSSIPGKIVAVGHSVVCILRHISRVIDLANFIIHVSLFRVAGYRQMMRGVNYSFSQ